MRHHQARPGWALAILLALASSTADAVRRADEGQALIYPLYATERVDTLLSLTNRSKQASAVGLSFREGKAGDYAIAFTVYLAPQDTFTIAATDLARAGLEDDGSGVVVSERETTCTIPAILNSPITGTDHRLFFTPDGEDSESRRFGYIEAIELGQLDASIDATDCDALEARWLDGGAWAMDPLDSLSAPSGRLSGQAYLVDVAQGESYTYPAVALADFRSAPLGLAEPTDVPPVVEASDALTAEVRTEDGDLELTYDSSHDAFSAALMVSHVATDFVADPDLGGSTDVIVTFPTLQTAVANADDGPRLPFVENPTEQAVQVDYEVTNRSGVERQDCRYVLFGIQPNNTPQRMLFDRAVSSIPMGVEPEQGLLGPTALPLLWGIPSVGAYFDIADYGGDLVRDGHLKLEMTGDTTDRFICDEEPFGGNHRLPPGERTDAPGETVVLAGLPVLVTTLTRIRNGNLPGGVLANYGLQPPAVISLRTVDP